jgi:predicted transcriptional regulator
MIEELVNTKYNSPNSRLPSDYCMGNWTLFSNHGHVLVCLARDSEARLRDVAASVGITERAVQKIVRDLQDGGMVSVTKNGRRNRYRIHKKQSLRHDLEANCTIGGLVKLVNKQPKAHQSMAEAESTPVSNTRSIEPKSIEPWPVNLKPETPAPAKVEKNKGKPGKSSVSDSIERQQGSLF